MNYTIENKGGINLLHIGDTVRPATDAEVDLVAQLQYQIAVNNAYVRMCEALDRNGVRVLAQPDGKTVDIIFDQRATNDVFEAYKTWPEDLRARLSVNDLRRMTGWKPQSQEDHVTDALEEGGIIDAYQAMDRRVAEAKKRGRPRGVTYSAEHDNFYDADGRGLGMDFYNTWRERRHDFPAYAPKGNENGN